MKINILISGGLYDSQSAYAGLRFGQAAIDAGHTIEQIFFYQQGVSIATQLSVPLADEFDSSEEWVSFAQMHSLPLVVFVSAAERRGVLGTEQQTEHAKQASNLHPAFSIAGLGALHEASLSSDRTVAFK